MFERGLPMIKTITKLAVSAASFAVRRFSDFHHSLRRVDELRVAANLPIVEDVLVRLRFLENMH